jgi:hypothetical protein
MRPIKLALAPLIKQTWSTPYLSASSKDLHHASIPYFQGDFSLSPSKATAM